MNEVELLLTEILNCERVSLYIDKDLHLAKEKSHLISAALKRRIQGEPIQYILGRTEFMGLEFKVNKNVFIPRPETEILVETVIKQLSVVGYQLSDINILDIGTGSGSIAISLAKLLSDDNVTITATDISPEALNIAKENAKANNVNINFIEADLFNAYNLTPLPVRQAGITYDLIVSNPPYIVTSQVDNLQPEIKYEPRIALDGGRDGLDFYRRLIPLSIGYLKEGGFLILEMGYNQVGKIENIFKNSPEYEIIEVVKDYNNIERVIVARIWIS